MATARSQAPAPKTRGPRIPPRVVRGALAAAVVLAAGTGLYLAARETSLFAVRTMQIAGGSPRVKAEVRRALAPELGRSLMRLDESALSRQVEALPDVVSATFDRSFPSTLRVRIRAERAVLLVRQGARASWVVSSQGRVMRKLRSPRRSSLPRLWLPAKVTLSTGETLTDENGKLAAAAVAPIAPGAFPGGVRTVSSGAGTLTLVLSAGPQIRLGGIGDLRLKLAIARRILHYAAMRGTRSPGYVDVSVPERPVLGSSSE